MPTIASYFRQQPATHDLSCRAVVMARHDGSATRDVTYDLYDVDDRLNYYEKTAEARGRNTRICVWWTNDTAWCYATETLSAQTGKCMSICWVVWFTVLIRIVILWSHTRTICQSLPLQLPLPFWRVSFTFTAVDNFVTQIFLHVALRSYNSAVQKKLSISPERA